MSVSLEDIYPFSPASFLHFSAQIECVNETMKNPYKKPFLLPTAEQFLSEEIFADVAMWYNKEGVFVSLVVHKAFEDVAFPCIEQGDGVELFFDTRDLKDRGSLHKFCHHFFFLPKEVGGIRACEMTKLRTEDAHPLCDPRLLQVETLFSKKSYEMQLVIKSEALYGFDPQRFNRMGFTYRIHRKGAPPQHFNVSSSDYMIERYPSLWASIKLKS